eukprot:292819-Pelagomonas_calceolata.AAC.4
MQQFTKSNWEILATAICDTHSSSYVFLHTERLAAEASRLSSRNALPSSIVQPWCRQVAALGIPTAGCFKHHTAGGRACPGTCCRGAAAEAGAAQACALWGAAHWQAAPRQLLGCHQELGWPAGAVW